MLSSLFLPCLYSRPKGGVWKQGQEGVARTPSSTILDGHNRYEICTRLGIEFETVEVEDCSTREAALAWIVANQLGRRNLTPSQRAALALELEKQLAIEAKKKEAERKSTLQKIEKSPLPVVHAAEQAAVMVGANRQYVSDAKKIEHDAPEVLEQVKQGKLSIPQAKKVAALPAEERPAALERVRQGKPVEEEVGSTNCGHSR